VPERAALTVPPRAATRPGARPRPHGGLWPLTLDHVWGAAVLAFAWVVGVTLQADQTDYWWTVKLGERLLATGALPTSDPLSFTATRQPYVEQQWLAQLVLAATHRLGGLEAALVLRGLLLGVTTALLYALCRRQGARAAAAASACGLALLSVVGGAAIRPQLLALPLFALFLYGTEAARGRRWPLVVLPPALVVWANLHGSFPLGIALVGLALAGRALELPPGAQVGDRTLRRLALLLALCGLAPLATPYGLGIVPWLVDYLRYNTGATGLATLSEEWLPTSMGTAHGVLFFAQVGLLAGLLVRVGAPPPADSLRLLAFAALALQALRSTVWWALVMAPVLAWALTRLASGDRAAGPDAADRRGVPALNAALVGGFAVVAVLALPWLRPHGWLFGPERWPVQDPGLPVAAADYVATLPATRLFNHMDWGGYLAWRLAPRQQIFVDGRFQLYAPALYRDYFRIASAGADWEERLAAYRVEALVLSRQDEARLLRALAASPRWQAVYCDALAAVYVPRPASAPVGTPCEPSE
jgi:hypothetical protein